MTDAHCHVVRGESRHFLCEPCDLASAGPGDMLFYGWHPWSLDGFDIDLLRSRLKADPRAGVGEIGLDRLRERTIPGEMRRAFELQLALAAELSRPVALHGAKCWGEVVKACAAFAGRIPAFVFHGFSRSPGLLPDIAAMNGYVSIGPALLNDHAVNYRELARAVPAGRLLVESDATAANGAETPHVEEIAALLAKLRGEPVEALAAAVEANADGIANFKGRNID